MVRIIKKVGFFLSDCQRWKKPTFGSFLALYGAKVGFHRSRPKVGFHFWKVGFSPLVGFRTAKGGLPCLEGGLFVSLAKGGLKRPNLGFSSGRWAFPCLTVFRTAKGGLPCLEGGLFVSLAKGGLKRPNLGFSSGRWAFPCLTVFRTARRLNLGFHAKGLPKVGFDGAKGGLPEGFEASKGRLPKVGLFGLIWAYLWQFFGSPEAYLILYILYVIDHRRN